VIPGIPLLKGNRCEVREKMIAWMQEVHPQTLPRWRGEVGARAQAPGEAMRERREALGHA
jgi:hypothetical protein